MQSCSVQCPLCQRRTARRACPALGHDICPVCCGTKRLIEINCPEDCVFLSASRHHPPAVVQRQQARDIAVLAPTLQGLANRQFRLLLLLASVIARHVPEDFHTLQDDDIAEAANAVASTLETASRGVIYEHRAGSRPAMHLAEDVKRFLAQLHEDGQRHAALGEEDQTSTAGLDRDAAVALRRIEQGARQRPAAAAGGQKTAYRELLGRIVNSRPGGPAAAAGREGKLIVS